MHLHTHVRAASVCGTVAGSSVEYRRRVSRLLLHVCLRLPETCCHRHAAAPRRDDMGCLQMKTVKAVTALRCSGGGEGEGVLGDCVRASKWLRASVHIPDNDGNILRSDLLVLYTVVLLLSLLPCFGVWS